jgi:5-methyltetrahydrofolate--homocysteine methyltransferase
MEREGFKLPLLIGGATTSRAHTVLKIAPNYSGPVIWVPDASRSVAVCSNLLSDELREPYLAEVRAEYERIRRQHAQKKGQGPHHKLEDARRHGLKTDWTEYQPPRPAFLGLKAFQDYPLEALIPFIDWTPFFQAWELRGRYPAILEDPAVGATARQLFADAQAMLQRIVEEKWLGASGVIGLFPANSVGSDDIEIYADESRARVLMTWHNLRQQMVKPPDRPNLCLADFIAPKGSGVRDYIGAFAVTAGLGAEPRVKAFEAAHDDYNAILLKALADRLAEAFAEHLHWRVRREFWGYAPEEDADNERLIREAYRGIRPAPGYPACPDHTEKGPLFRLLAADKHAHMQLTDAYAMLPAASVSGFYFSHPQSQYFAVGKIDRDQVEDYARRKGWDLETAERWLAPVLNYEREPVAVD